MGTDGISWTPDSGHSAIGGRSVMGGNSVIG
jgi:hypothetical protein